MGWHDLILQNFFGIVASVIASVLGYIAIRILRGIRGSTDRTEEHAKETAKAVSQLDKVSLTASNTALEEWQRDIALRVEAVAEGKSDTLAWQAQFDRRLAELAGRQDRTEQFIRELSDFAHGRAGVPNYTTTTTTIALQEETA